MAGHLQTEMSYIRSPPLTRNFRTTIPQRVRELAAEHPDRVAFVFRSPGLPREAITRREFLDAATSLAKHLVLAGINVTDRIPVLVPSGKSWLIIQVALYMTGAVPINFWDANPRDLSLLVTNFRCSAIISQTTLPSAETLSLHEDEHIQKSTIVLSFTQYSAYFGKVLDLSTLASSPSPKDVVLPDVDPSSPALMLSTSGSTGDPKFVTHTHASLLFASYSTYSMLPKCKYPECDIYVNDRPMVWMGGYPLLFLCNGTLTVYVISHLSQEEDDAFFVDVLARESPYIVRFTEHRTKSLQTKPELLTRIPKIQQVLTTGQRVRAKAMHELLEIGSAVTCGYGVTESFNCFLITVRNREEFEDGAIGMLACGCEAKLIDDDGVVVPFGDEGELCLKGNGTAREYTFMDGSRGQVVDEEGWHHTGDIAIFRKGGYAVIEGRKTECIKRATVRIFPATIEKRLEEVLDVIEVAAIGIPDDKLNQEVCICIIPKPGSKLTLEDVRSKAVQIFQPSAAPDGLGHMPGFFLFMEEFPRTKTSAKCDRPALILKATKILERK